MSSTTSLIRIESLSGVHIGSGEKLQSGSDFFNLIKDNNHYVGITDPEKVLKLIGKQNINKWTALIDKKKSTEEIVKLIKSQCKATDYTKRLLFSGKKIILKPSEKLSTQIHDGQGNPYIPGSSIKGAIRSAVLAEMAKSRLVDSEVKTLESTLFGKIQYDNFRFLQVGDALFGKEYTEITRLEHINIRKSEDFYDTGKSILVEIIGKNDKAHFRLKINHQLLEIVQGKNEFVKQPQCFNSVSDLFETINRHTLYLIESEIQKWNKHKHADTDDRNIVKLMIECLQDLKDDCASYKIGEECMLRIGFGSGWRFMTGAWTEKIDNFNKEVVNEARYKNSMRYSEYEFPKTRRINYIDNDDDDYIELIGFVKLSKEK